MPSLVFPALVRAEVLRQHAQLRPLLAQLAAGAENDAAGRVLDAEPNADAALATLVRCLYIRMQTHLAYEDQALRPVLYFLDSFGPERVRELDETHARQRAELERLLEQLEHGTDSATVAADLQMLTAELLRDMDEEEERTLQTDLMTSDYLTAERR